MSKRQFIILETIRVLYILLFVYAAVNKLLDIEKFRVQIGQSPMLTDIAWLVAWAIPSIEILIAICLSIPKYKIIGFYAALEPDDCLYRIHHSNNSVQSVHPLLMRRYSREAGLDRTPDLQYSIRLTCNSCYTSFG